MVADSTGYAETIAAYEAIKELHYLKAFLEEMNIQIAPVPLMLDASNIISNLTHNNSYKQSGVKFYELQVSAEYQYVNIWVSALHTDSKLKEHCRRVDEK